jgi:hypothetical protein
MFEIIDEYILSLNNDLKDPQGRTFLELQMLYLLLWTSIERFASFRFNFRGQEVNNKLKQLSNTIEFRKAHIVALNKYPVDKNRVKIYSTDKIEKFYKLDSDDPKQFIDAHYQVRCNIAHRGKGIITDTQLIYSCLLRMRSLFEELIIEIRKNSNLQ